MLVTGMQMFAGVPRDVVSNDSGVVDDDIFWLFQWLPATSSETLDESQHCLQSAGKHRHQQKAALWQGNRTMPL